MVGAVALAAAIWAVAGSGWIFPELSANSDEGIYLLQAETLRTGDLAPPAAVVDATAFVPWFATIEDGRYVLKYTPVHAAVLAVGDALPGPSSVALGLIAAGQVLAVAALATELGLSARDRLLACVLFAASPLVVQLDVTYLAYGTSLVLGLTALTAALRAARTSSLAAAAGAGVLWGLAVFARPWDGLLFGLIIAVAVLARRRDRGLVRLVVAGTAAALVPLAAFLAHNEALTGDPFQLPFNLLESDDRLGFGRRRALPTDPFVDYGPSEAVSSIGRNLFLVVNWTAGGLVTVGLAAWALLRDRIPRAPVVATVVVWTLGYASFWGSYLAAFVWDGALFLGPYYYLTLVPVLAVAGAVGFGRLRSDWPGAARAAAAGMTVLTLAVIVPALSEQLDRSSARVEVADALDRTVEGPALVFVPPIYGPYLQNPFSFLRNSPTLDGDVVYALSRSTEEDRRVRSLFPERTAYRLDLGNGWSDRPGFDPVISVEPLGDEG